MKRMIGWRGVLGFAALCCVPAISRGAVVINEVQYDDSSTDNSEFVEIYNSGAGPVDISGWILRGSDVAPPGDNNPDYTIPGAAGSGTTMLAGGGYYVLGAGTVPNVNQNVGATNLWENDNEGLELLDGAGAVQDTVVYERGLGAPGIGTPEGSIWGTLTSSDEGTAVDFTNQSWSRWTDARDSGINGRDFGLRPRTPGASNLGSASFISAYTPANVDAMTPGDVVPGITGSFRNARVINPTDASTLLGTNDINPNAIPASPQGGNAIVAWDPTGGGNTTNSNDLFNADGNFDLFAYFDTSAIAVAGGESTAYGLMGTEDTSHLFPDPGSDGFTTPADAVTLNGITGVAWVYQKVGNTRKLYLVDAHAGGDSSDGPTTPTDWEVFASLDLSGEASDWYRMSIDYDATTGLVVAFFGNQMFSFTTDTGLLGAFYTGYRESLSGTPTTLRPPTFDMLPEPGTLGLLALGGLALLRRRR